MLRPLQVHVRRWLRTSAPACTHHPTLPLQPLASACRRHHPSRSTPPARPLPASCLQFAAFLPSCSYGARPGKGSGLCGTMMYSELRAAGTSRPAPRAVRRSACRTPGAPPPALPPPPPPPATPPAPAPAPLLAPAPATRARPRPRNAQRATRSRTRTRCYFCRTRIESLLSPSRQGAAVTTTRPPRLTSPTSLPLAGTATPRKARG